MSRGQKSEGVEMPRRGPTRGVATGGQEPGEVSISGVQICRETAKNGETFRGRFDGSSGDLVDPVVTPLVRPLGSDVTPL